MSYMKKRANAWVEEEVLIYGGIPMNPSYLDGTVTDRHGKTMTFKKQSALEYYRREQRAEWRLNNNNIKGVSDV